MMQNMRRRVVCSHWYLAAFQLSKAFVSLFYAGTCLATLSRRSPKPVRVLGLEELGLGGGVHTHRRSLLVMTRTQTQYL